MWLWGSQCSQDGKASFPAADTWKRCQHELSATVTAQPENDHNGNRWSSLNCGKGLRHSSELLWGELTRLLGRIYLLRKPSTARWASVEGKRFTQGHTAGTQQCWHANTHLIPGNWGSRMLWVFIPVTFPATSSPALPAESSLRVSSLGTPFQPRLRLLPCPLQT